MPTPDKLRNIAIIAHVDHGKTTLVDQLLKQSGTLESRTQTSERMMDSHDLEKERGITILAKNTAITWGDYHINIVDTPGHADFGGEVERILSMVDSVLLLVDAVDGPMPQTRFVTRKAFARGLRPIVVINKIDRPGARPDWVMDQVFDLFDSLGATDEQLDFPLIYASALQGYAAKDIDDPKENMTPLFEAIVEHCPTPDVDSSGSLQMQISALDYSSYVGMIGIGRVTRGQLKPKTPITIISRDGETRSGRVLQILGFHGLERVEVDHAEAGDIIAISGIDKLQISDTLCDPSNVEALPSLSVDEPTLRIIMRVNDSPLAGQEGKFVTSRQIHERLETETLHNVALQVTPTSEPDAFEVAGRGELHLAILIETMRREGYEMAISRPQVIFKTIDDVEQEPYEQVSIDIEQDHQGNVMQLLTSRRGELQDMSTDNQGRLRLDFIAPTRSLIGFHSLFIQATGGSGILTHAFSHYGPLISGDFNTRHQGALIANAAGTAKAYALWNLQARGQLLIEPQTTVYEGMVVGLHTRENDLVVNVCREKQLTNVRAAGKDEAIVLTPPLQLTLEKAITLLNDDELLEVTPQTLRLRKRLLKEHERKRSSRQ